KTQQGTTDIGLSTAIVVAVCEDGRPLASFEAKPCSNSPSAIPVGTGLSSVVRKLGAHKVVPTVPVADLFRRYQVLRLIPNSLHGWVADRDSDCGRIPSARRLRSSRSLALRFRSSFRARFLTLTLPMVVRRKACRCS